MENKKISEVLLANQNCVQLLCFTCNACGINVATIQAGAEVCPKPECDGMLEAEQPVVVGRRICTHTKGADGHEYMPNE